MKFDYTRLKGRIIDIFGDDKTFGESVGTSSKQLSKIFNNKCELTRSDISKWKQMLNIPDSEIEQYFFVEGR